MSEVKTLIKKLEKEKQPSYELDLEIMKFLDYVDKKCTIDGNKYRFPGSRHSSNIIPYTSSIDASIRIIPDNFKLLELSGYVGQWKAKVAKNITHGMGLVFDGSHRYPAIAITISALRAREHNKTK